MAGAELFLQALDRMPCLEELRVCGVFTSRIGDRTWDVPEGSQSLITVPRLRRLEIAYEGQPFTIMLLNRLFTPSLRHLILNRLDEGLRRDSDMLHAAVSQKAATLGPFSTLSYDWYDEYFAAYRDTLERTLEPKHDSTLEWLEQRAAALDVSLRRGPPHIIASPRRWETTTLILHVSLGFPAVGPHGWHSLMQGMESVTELRLHDGMFVEGPVAEMLSSRHPDLGDGRAPFVLPKLNTVTMDKLRFYTEREFGTMLATCFAQRALEAAEIKTLRILHAQDLSSKGYVSLCDVMPCLVETDGYHLDFRSE